MLSPEAEKHFETIYQAHSNLERVMDLVNEAVKKRWEAHVEVAAVRMNSADGLVVMSRVDGAPGARRIASSYGTHAFVLDRFIPSGTVDAMSAEEAEEHTSRHEDLEALKGFRGRLSEEVFRKAFDEILGLEPLAEDA